MLETTEGKSMAIDSSIWIYQFQATMRDKEGRGLVNAHVLGFLRRITKLMFYGIKPVFVFDGGAPTLKRSTLVRTLHSFLTTSFERVSYRMIAERRRRVLLRVMPRSRNNCSPHSCARKR
jgi:DNA excision repair protein ERCC-5